MKTKKPSAIVYGLDTVGDLKLISDVYFEENLFDEVVVYSLDYVDSVIEDYTKYKPDLIISIGKKINIPHYQLTRRHIHLDETPGDKIRKAMKQFTCDLCGGLMGLVEYNFRPCSPDVLDHLPASDLKILGDPPDKSSRIAC